METSLSIRNNSDMDPSQINIDKVKDLADKIYEHKEKYLAKSFEESKILHQEFESMKLQNEELDIQLQDMTKENYRISESYKILMNSYNILSRKYADCQKLLENSRQQNVQLTGILEKCRENEKCLINENRNLRIVGTSQATSDVLKEVNQDTMKSLEKELKYWQTEAENLSQMVKLLERSENSENIDKCTMKGRSLRSINSGKRYKKVVHRSNSVESTQKKSKEKAFESLKMEKEQMKELLNNLENQIIEIQDNVVKISAERQKYKDLYFHAKSEFEQVGTVLSNYEREVSEWSEMNSRLCFENKGLNENISTLTQDNLQIQQMNQSLLREYEEIKEDHSREMEEMERKIYGLFKENHDLGVRSCNLKENVLALESDVIKLEEELKNKCTELDAKTELTNNLIKQLENTKDKLMKTEESLTSSINKFAESEGKRKDIVVILDKITQELNSKCQDVGYLQETIKKMNEQIESMQNAFSVQIIKFENYLKNAEQIISTKVKLISSLELKVANYKNSLEVTNDELLLLKRKLNTKEYDFQLLNQKYLDEQEVIKNSEVQHDNLKQVSNNLHCENQSLNQCVSDMKNEIESLKDENETQTKELETKERKLMSLTEELNKFEQVIFEKEEDIRKNVSIIRQLQCIVEQKEVDLRSLLEVVDDKDRKLSSFEKILETNEEKMRHCIDKLNNYDRCVIQSTAKNSALEREIEYLRNTNNRLLKQKEDLNEVLTSRNKLIGQLEVQLVEAGKSTLALQSNKQFQSKDESPFGNCPEVTSD